MDAAITHWINTPADMHPVLDTVLIGFTQFGVPLLVLAVMMQWWTKEDRTHVRHAALASGLSFLLGLAINQAILLFIHRIRPYDAGVSHLIIAPNADWSFPSDHATAAMFVVAAFALQRLPRRTLALFPSGIHDLLVQGLCRNALHFRCSRRRMHGHLGGCYCPAWLSRRDEARPAGDKHFLTSADRLGKVGTPQSFQSPDASYFKQDRWLSQGQWRRCHG